MIRIPAENPSRRLRVQAGFTFVELMVGLTLFAGVALFMLQAFMNGMAYANRSDEKAAATSIGIQIMEQIKASANPYTMVNIADIPRTTLPLPAPYDGIANPSPHTFQVSVTVAPDPNLQVITAAVNVYRPADPDAAPLVSLSTLVGAK